MLLVGGFLPPLDFYIVNVALPSIRQGLGAGDDVIQLVMSGFAAAYAVLLVMGGRLGDLYGRNRMFMIGMAGFALCSAWCGLAWSPYALVMARILQGATAAIMAPQVAASIHVLFAPEEKARAFSLFGTSIGLSAITGQILAGALIWANIWGLGWRTIFLINVPIVAITLVAAIPLLRDFRHLTSAIQPLDISGSILLFLGLSALVCSLIEGRQENWPVWSFVLMGSCPVLLAWFWQVEVRLAARGGSPSHTSPPFCRARLCPRTRRHASVLFDVQLLPVLLDLSAGGIAVFGIPCGHQHCAFRHRLCCRVPEHSCLSPRRGHASRPPSGCLSRLRA